MGGFPYVVNTFLVPKSNRFAVIDDCVIFYKFAHKRAVFIQNGRVSKNPYGTVKQMGGFPYVDNTFLVPK